VKYDAVELEEKLTFPEETLHYFRSKLDDKAILCFQMVAESTNSPYGLLRTKIPDFNQNRRAYDLGFTILEAQGFIQAIGIGNMRPYFLTIRGKQLNELLKSENI
jgi:hypothetical protein